MELDIYMPKVARGGGKSIDAAHKSVNEIGKYILNSFRDCANKLYIGIVLNPYSSDANRSDSCVYVQLKPVSTTETRTNQI